jgi:hypothetical protein
MKEEKENLFLKFLGYFIGPIQFVMEVCTRVLFPPSLTSCSLVLCPLCPMCPHCMYSPSTEARLVAAWVPQLQGEKTRDNPPSAPC